MNIDSVFNTPIFYDRLNFNLQDLEEYAARLQSISDGRVVSNRLGWQSNDIQNDEDIQGLVELINNKLTEVHTYSGIKDNFQLVVDDIWININSKYSYNANHMHFKSFFSGVYYVKVPENSGNIQFTNPSNLQRVSVELYKSAFKEFNTFNAQNWMFQPVEDLLILFPSWLEHSVGQNLSDHSRISIAFNTTIK